MAAPTLHLAVIKGPKQGQSLSCVPGASIRVGRVIKGNTFTIKDPAISQKHLLIDFSPSLSQWTLTDLDTSNGTLINDAEIPSSTPVPLSDGDTVKVGVSTSISVRIEEEIGGGVRRGRSRKGNSKKDEILEEESVVKVGPRRAGLRTRAAAAKKDEILEEAVEAVNGRKTKRGPGRRARASSAKILEVGEKGDKEARNEVGEDCVGERGNAEGRKTRKAAGRTRASAKVVEAHEDVCDKGAVNVESNGDGDGEETRNDGGGNKEKRDEEENVVTVESNANSEAQDLRNEVVEDSVEKLENVKGRKTTKALGRTRASSVKHATADVVIQYEEAEKREVNAERNGDDEVSGGRHGERGDKGKRIEEETVVDFEKMTLGEWFDSMEKYLPLAINEVAEQMIADLREKARRFDEYIATEG